MSVLVKDRHPTTTQVFHDCIKTRHHIHEFCLKKLGYLGRQPKTPPLSYQLMSLEQQKAWTEQEQKEREQCKQFDEWYIVSEREALNNRIRELTDCLSILGDDDENVRAKMPRGKFARLQESAMDLCTELIAELQTIAETIPANLNWYTALTTQLLQLKYDIIGMKL